jgi:metal-responsive CopG/Arc/MetJ family transcriptional regulator
MRVVTFKLEEDMLTKIDKLALSLGMRRSDLIREALAYYIANYKNLKKFNNNSLKFRKVVLA